MKKEFEVTKFLNDTKEIDESNINISMANNHTLIAYYGYQYALWQTYLQSLKLLLDTKSSRFEIELREDAEKNSKKTTEASIKASISMHPEVEKIKIESTKAGEQVALYSNAISSIENRGKMLVALGAMIRQEMSGDISINQKNEHFNEKRIMRQELAKRVGSSSTEIDETD
jgi:hypothetical protein